MSLPMSSSCLGSGTELSCIHGRVRLGAGRRRSRHGCDRIGTPVVPSAGCRQTGRPDALRRDQGEGRLSPITRQRSNSQRCRTPTSVDAPFPQKQKPRTQHSPIVCTARFSVIGDKQPDGPSCSLKPPDRQVFPQCAQRRTIWPLPYGNAGEGERGL